MKKIVSFWLVILMFSMTVSPIFADIASGYLLLRAGNFKINDAQWKVTELTGEDKAAGDNTLYIARKSGEPSVSAKVYIPVSGNYRILSLGKDSNDSSFGNRGYKVSVDKIDLDYKFGNVGDSAKVGWSWDTNAPAISLERGWHTFTVTADGSYIRLCAMFITNDEVFSPPADISAYEDLTAPEVSGLKAVGKGETFIDLQWSGDACGYELYRDGELIKELDSCSYTDSDLESGTTYIYKIRGIDQIGNSSEISMEVKTDGNIDTTAPVWTSGGGVKIKQITSVNAAVIWEGAEDDRGIAGYEIYRDDELIDTVSGSVTEYKFGPFPIGSSFTVSVKAKDRAGNISDSTAVLVNCLRNEFILLRPENFDKGKWEQRAESGGGILPGADGQNASYLYSGSKQTGNVAKADFYVSTGGAYTLWSLSRDKLNITDTAVRLYSIETDGKKGGTVFGKSGETGWTWEKGHNLNLAEGWHSLSVISETTEVQVAAIALVQNDGFVLDSEITARYAEILADYDDVTPPEFTGNIKFDYLNPGNLKVSFDKGGDDVVCYRVYLNDSVEYSELLPGTNFIDLSGLHELESVRVSVEAIDRYANKKASVASTIVSPAEVTKFEIVNSAGQSIGNINSLAGQDKAGVNAAIKNISKSSRPILLYIALYTSDEKTMIAGSRQSFTLEPGSGTEVSCEISLPQNIEGCIIKAGIWDSREGIAPMIFGKKIA